MKTYFDILRPSAQPVPILVDVPHAGEWIPERIKNEMTIGDRVLRRDLDLYVDQIWQDAPAHGATLIVSNVSRYVVDLNRSAEDVSEHTVVGGKRVYRPGFYQDRGVVWRTTTGGTAVMGEAMSQKTFADRIETFHTPYHEAIQQEISTIKEAFGFCILLDGHSMPSIGRRKTSDEQLRADIVPGDVNGTSCDSSLLEIICEHFKDRGFSVEPNAPYAGGWITRSFGKPKLRVHAIQLEINRDLYMDEKTYVQKPDGMNRLRESCCSVINKLAVLKF